MTQKFRFRSPALTPSGCCGLPGVRPGGVPGAVARSLGMGARFRVGLNVSWLAPERSSIVKVCRGVVEEVGTADERLTQGRAAWSGFLERSF